jgi:hypothetical protein
MDEFRMLLMSVYTSSVCRMSFTSSKESINHTDLHEDTQERKGCDKDIGYCACRATTLSALI